MSYTVGSICSGIEAASVAWLPLGFRFEWFSEIAPFPARVLETHYPDVANLGNMRKIAKLLKEGSVYAPDIICAGTPCQAFSFAGWKKGLNDDRGNLTLELVDIVNANDEARLRQGRDQCLVFWENVVGVLSDKTNAFGCFISSLAGLSDVLTTASGKWPTAGLLRGPRRTVAWRVLDAKYFGLPQQRKRLYVMAGSQSSCVESVVFERTRNPYTDFMPRYAGGKKSYTFEKNRCTFEVFREYTDCLYASYATKWNGNAAAYNGSLFVVENNRVRRFSPLECERLMGFPDDYTKIENAARSQRYQAIGNSWSVPVVKWFGERIARGVSDLFEHTFPVFCGDDDIEYHDLSAGAIELRDGTYINSSAVPECAERGFLADIVSPSDVSEIFLSPVGSAGIVRRKRERRAKMNERLETFLVAQASSMDAEEIERLSRVQKRGKHSARRNE